MLLSQFSIPQLYLFLNSLRTPEKESISIYGQAIFQKVCDYLKKAHYSSQARDESAIMVGLKAIMTNIRDCFLVDQLVFLEKQAEALQAMHQTPSLNHH